MAYLTTGASTGFGGGVGKVGNMVSQLVRSCFMVDASSPPRRVEIAASLARSSSCWYIKDGISGGAEG